MRKLVAMTVVAIILLNAFTLKISAPPQERTIEIHDTDSSYNKTVNAGGSTTYNWTVENKGARDRNITVEVDNKNSDWNASVDKESFTVPGRSSVGVTLTVISPTDGKNGERLQVNVVFTAKAETGYQEEQYKKSTNTTIGEETNDGKNGNVNIPNNPTEDFTERRVATDYYKLVGLVALLLVLIGLLGWYFKKRKK